MKLNREISEICGALTGDGWIESRGLSLYLAGHPVDDRDYYDNYIIPLFNNKISKVEPKYFKYWGVYGFSLYNKKIIDDFINLGIQKGKKVYSCRVPDWCFNSKDLMKGFLTGIFDTDGSIFCGKSYKVKNYFKKTYHHDARIRIGSTSLQLIKDISKLGKLIGIKFTKIRIKKASKYPNKNNKISYIIELNKKSEIIRWFEVLKLSNNNKHITKYNIWKKFGFCPPNTHIDERQKILKGDINPHSYYVGVPERSNGVEIIA